MKVGLFTDAYLPEITGVTIFVSTFKKELEKHGHEAFVYAPDYKRKIKQRKVYRFKAGPVFGYKVARISWPFSFRAFKSFKNLDIVHSHTPFSLAYAGFWAAFKYKIPHIHTYHTKLNDYLHYVPKIIRPSRKLTEKYSAFICNKADLITVPTLSMKKELLNYGVKKPIQVVFHGIGSDFFKKQNVWNPRKALEIGQDDFVFIYAGRLAKEKNLIFLLDCFKEINKKISKSVLVLAGSGPQEKNLKKRVFDLGIQKYVRFSGCLEQKKLIDLYYSSNLFVFASKTETQGLVIAEAMAAGLPTVAVNAQGVCDVIDGQINGFLVPEDKQIFAKKCLELFENKNLYNNLSKQAEKDSKKLGIDDTVKEMSKIYNCLTKKHKVIRID